VYSLQRILILLLFLCSCNRSSNFLIFKGNTKNSSKVFTALQACKLPAKINYTSEDIGVISGDSHYEDSYSIILGLIKPYIGAGDSPSKVEIRDYFIPKKENPKSKLVVDGFPDKAIEELIDSPFVLDVRRQVDSVSGKKVYVLSYIDVPVVKSEIDTLLRNLDPVLSGFEIKLNEVNVSMLLKSQNIGLSTLTILEPFSFHVLKSEKTLAGVQFLMLLMLFLLSGFILGLWWKGRIGNRRSR
jgi:hypothetical protein